MAEPVYLKGAVKDYIWGGTKLRELFGKESEKKIIAESWELSCHEDGCSYVDSGCDKGITLMKYFKKYGEESILGSRCTVPDNMPLIKLIDAKEPLSVQVHPDDFYALEKGFSKGKTEMWYVLDAEEGAQLVYGVNRHITREELACHIADGTLEDILNYVPVKKGDVFFIPAGTLHAIGKGIIIAEVQQNSNLTYRVYDYNRRDMEGNLRPLHIEDAVAVTKLEPSCEESIFPQWRFPWGESRTLAYCEYFAVNFIKVTGKRSFCADHKSFVHILVTDGSGELLAEGKKLPMKKGDSILIAANTGNCRIYGNVEYIETCVPSAEE